MKRKVFFRQQLQRAPVGEKEYWDEKENGLRALLVDLLD